jgi:[ribosomal protein S18]-alanine N-acetyltransferase
MQSVEHPVTLTRAHITPRCALHYRPIQENDLNIIMNIEQQAYRYPWRESIFRDCLKAGYHCWLIQENNTILGYGIMTVAVGEAQILNLCIDPHYQNHRLGRGLLKFLLAKARLHGALSVFLEVRPSNKAACMLYQNLGFNEVGLRRNYYPNGNKREDAIIMALELSTIGIC